MLATSSLDRLLSELGNDPYAVRKTLVSALEATRKSDLNHRAAECLMQRLRVAAGEIFFLRHGDIRVREEKLFAAAETEELMQAIAAEDNGEAIVHVLKNVMKHQKQVQRDLMNTTA